MHCDAEPSVSAFPKLRPHLHSASADVPHTFSLTRPMPLASFPYSLGFVSTRNGQALSASSPTMTGGRRLGEWLAVASCGSAPARGRAGLASSARPSASLRPDCSALPTSFLAQRHTTSAAASSATAQIAAPVAFALDRLFPIFSLSAFTLSFRRLLLLVAVIHHSLRAAFLLVFPNPKIQSQTVIHHISHRITV